MDASAILRDAIWAGILEKSEQRRSEYLNTLKRLGSHSHDLEQRVAATANHFASLAKELSSGAEAAWLVTKGSEPAEDKAEIQAKLHGELRAAKDWYLKRASVHLQKKNARRVSKAAKQVLGEIESVAMDVFQRSESPFSDDGGASREPSSYNPRLKILFLSADASRANDGGRPASALNLDLELREIQEAIRGGSLRDHIDLRFATAVTKEDLVNEINRHKPAVVHFSGHGGSVGVALIGKLGTLEQVHPNFLRQIFLSSPSVQFVVLNACHSAKQAEAISHVVGPTIGTETEIDDDLAVRFSRSLYSAISNGLPLDAILRQLDTLLGGEAERNRPILYNGRAADLRTLVLAKDPKHADFAILIGRLHRAVVEFSAGDEKLIKILDDAAVLTMARRKYGFKAPAIPAEKLKGLRRFDTVVLERELARVDVFLSEISNLIRRWMSRISPEALAKLEALEESVAEIKPHVLKVASHLKRTLDFIDRQDSSDATEVDAEIWAGMVSLLGQLGMLLKKMRSVSALYFNQTLELIPGGRESGKFLKVEENAEPFE